MTNKWYIPGSNSQFASFAKSEANTDGGAGSNLADGTEADSDDSDEDGSAESDADESADGSKTGKPKTIPYKRFKEVNDLLKQYKQLGSPEEIAALAQEYLSIKEAVFRQGGAASETKQEKKESKIPADKRAKVLETLEEIIPGISKFPELLEELGRIKGVQQASNQRALSDLQTKASDLVHKLAEEEGFDSADFAYIEDIVANAVYSTPELYRKFLRGDMSVVRDVFKQYNDSFFSKRILKPAKPKKVNIPALLAGAKGMPSGGKVKPKYTDEQLAKMHPKDAMNKIGEDAWDLYNEIASANAAERGL